MSTFLANLIVALHALIIACVIGGAAAAVSGHLRRHPLWERLYYLLLVLIIASDRLLGECILTRWEKALRNQAQAGSAYRSSCMGHYLPFLPHSVLAFAVPTLIATALLAFPLWRWIDRRRPARIKPKGTD